MREIFAIILFSGLMGQLFAQTDSITISTYSSRFDSLYSPLISGTVPYNRLYDRVFPWVNKEEKVCE